MRRTRIFTDQPIKAGQTLVLQEDAANHVARVLRARVGDGVVIFNGHGGEYEVELTQVEKCHVEARVIQFVDSQNESPLHITLAQAISRGQKMDFTLQKATELGVACIVPILTEHGDVRLDASRTEKKMEHWKKVIQGACEQCGRNILPELHEPMSFNDWIAQDTSPMKLIMHPGGGESIPGLSLNEQKMSLVVGPEGGFSDEEIEKAKEKDYLSVSVGPRVLRTETAGLAAISLCQGLWGDFS